MKTCGCNCGWHESANSLILNESEKQRVRIIMKVELRLHILKGIRRFGRVLWLYQPPTPTNLFIDTGSLKPDSVQKWDSGGFKGTKAALKCPSKQTCPVKTLRNMWSTQRPIKLCENTLDNNSACQLSLLQPQTTQNPNLQKMLL